MKLSKDQLAQLKVNIQHWANELGFAQVGISNTDLSTATPAFQAFIANHYHGSMSYLEKNAELYCNPNLLLPNTVSIISVRMDYLPPNHQSLSTLKNKNQAYIARYALGRDYHKVLRKRLQKLADKINQTIGPFGYRAFCDSAPVLEKPIAVKAGLGWMGKNTLVLNRSAGSYFFLGELFTDLPLALDQAVTEHCGSCRACLDICPTQAFVAPYVLDARRCISYLTIENKGSIPQTLRSAIGNRIFGCDDCQIICPWNKFAKLTRETSFHIRHQLQQSNLIDLFNWNETQYLKYTEGSALRRAGYNGWLRNVAIGIGNAPYSPHNMTALNNKKNHSNDMVQEHIQWALDQQQQKQT